MIIIGVTSFLFNLPWTFLGLLPALLSLPVRASFHVRPFAFLIEVRSFWWQSWLPGHKGVRASTIGNIVLLGPRLLPHDLEHELIHVQQYEHEPLIHPFLYIYQVLRHGYRNNKYEVEAYQKAGNTYVEK